MMLNCRVESANGIIAACCVLRNLSIETEDLSVYLNKEQASCPPLDRSYGRAGTKEKRDKIKELSSLNDKSCIDWCSRYIDKAKNGPRLRSRVYCIIRTENPLSLSHDLISLKVIHESPGIDGGRPSSSPTKIILTVCAL